MQYCTLLPRATSKMTVGCYTGQAAASNAQKMCAPITRFTDGHWIQRWTPIPHSDVRKGRRSCSLLIAAHREGVNIASRDR